jgi:hypothetical protein
MANKSLAHRGKILAAPHRVGEMVPRGGQVELWCRCRGLKLPRREQVHAQKGETAEGTFSCTSELNPGMAWAGSQGQHMGQDFSNSTKAWLVGAKTA